MTTRPMGSRRVRAFADMGPIGSYSCRMLFMLYAFCNVTLS
jgi:hypothetical protein